MLEDQNTTMIWTEKPAITIIFLITSDKEMVAKERERAINAMDVPFLLAEKAKARAKISPHQPLLGRTDCQMEHEYASFISRMHAAKVTIVLIHTPLHASNGKMAIALLERIVFMLITTMLRRTKVSRLAEIPASIAQLAPKNVPWPTSKLNIEPRRTKIDHNEKDLQLLIERKEV